MPSLRSLALAFLLVPCYGCDSAPSPDPTAGTTKPDRVTVDTIRIGTWNLEHFGQRDKFQDRPNSPKNRTPDQLRAIAKFIAEMGVDVLALQEIGGPEPLTRLLRHLGDEFRFVLGTTGVYDDTRISVGFLWNSKRVELLQCEEMADFPRKVGDLAVFHRKPVNAVFRTVGGGLDFRAITVHLKASRGRKNEAKRTAEVGVLRDYIRLLQSRTGEDQDIVVLGDFNHTYGAPAHRAFVVDDVVQYAKEEPSPTVPSPTIVWFDEPIDQIAMTKGIRDEVVPGSFRIHNQRGEYTAASKDKITPVELRWRVAYSDHFPVTIDLAAAVDNDPDKTFAAPTHVLPVGGEK